MLLFGLVEFKQFLNNIIISATVPVNEDFHTKCVKKGQYFTSPQKSQNLNLKVRMKRLFGRVPSQ